MSKWHESDIPSMDGCKIVVTGGTSGIGLQAVDMLAGVGADVWLCGRTAEKAKSVTDRMHGHVRPFALELDSLDAIHRAAERLGNETDLIDIAINNAGIMAVPLMLTVDGFESQFGVNHLGHFAWMSRIWPLLKNSDAARVVTVSSILHNRGRIDFDNLNAEISYDKHGAYAQSKLANLLFSKELARRAPDMKSLAVHPGYANTSLLGCNARITGNKVESAVMSVLNRVAAQSSRHGAWPTVYAATTSEIESGSYVGPSGIAGLRGAPHVTRCSTRATDSSVAARLWQESERLTNITFAV